jgi:hypothetical protein
MLESLSARKCLAVPESPAVNGAQLVITDCYCDPGQARAVF